MTYICLVEFALRTAPLRAPLAARTLDEAKLEARDLLERHGSACAAHIYEGDERVASVRRPERSLSTRHPPL